MTTQSNFEPWTVIQAFGKADTMAGAVEHAATWSDPERILVVTSPAEEPAARALLDSFGPFQIVVQPRDLGTGPGLLLAVAHVLDKEPDGTIIVAPCPSPEGDLESIAREVQSAAVLANDGGPIVLVGAAPKSIVVNPFMTGCARRFWELGRRHLPGQSALLYAYRRAIGTPWQRPLLAEVYADMKPADFVRDVLRQEQSIRYYPDSASDSLASGDVPGSAPLSVPLQAVAARHAECTARAS